MKLIILIALACLLTACQPAQEASETAQEAAKTTIAQIDRAKVLSDINTVKTAVNAYQLEKQKYPETLAELSLSLNYPDDLSYDASTGQISSKTFPNLK